MGKKEEVKETKKTAPAAPPVKQAAPVGNSWAAMARKGAVATPPPAPVEPQSAEQNKGDAAASQKAKKVPEKAAELPSLGGGQPELPAPSKIWGPKAKEIIAAPPRDPTPPVEEPVVEPPPPPPPPQNFRLVEAKSKKPKKGRHLTKDPAENGSAEDDQGDAPAEDSPASVTASQGTDGNSVVDSSSGATASEHTSVVDSHDAQSRAEQPAPETATIEPLKSPSKSSEDSALAQEVPEESQPHSLQVQPQHSPPTPNRHPDTHTTHHQGSKQSSAAPSPKRSSGDSHPDPTPPQSVASQDHAPEQDAVLTSQPAGRHVTPVSPPSIPAKAPSRFSWADSPWDPHDPHSTADEVSLDFLSVKPVSKLPSPPRPAKLSSNPTSIPTSPSSQPPHLISGQCVRPEVERAPQWNEGEPLVVPAALTTSAFFRIAAPNREFYVPPSPKVSKSELASAASEAEKLRNECERLRSELKTLKARCEQKERSEQQLSTQVSYYASQLQEAQAIAERLREEKRGWDQERKHYIQMTDSVAQLRTHLDSFPTAQPGSSQPREVATQPHRNLSSGFPITANNGGRGSGTPGFGTPSHTSIGQGRGINQSHHAPSVPQHRQSPVSTIPTNYGNNQFPATRGGFSNAEDTTAGYAWDGVQDYAQDASGSMDPMGYSSGQGRYHPGTTAYGGGYGAAGSGAVPGSGIGRAAGGAVQPGGYSVPQFTNTGGRPMGIGNTATGTPAVVVGGRPVRGPPGNVGGGIPQHGMDGQYAQFQKRQY